MANINKQKTALFQDDDQNLAWAGDFASAGIEAMIKGVPSDPSVGSQWYLTGTWGLHANLVWPDYTGAGIKLADLDDGFQYTHPDLAPNYDTNLDRDFASNDLDAVAGAKDNHGTAVMGVMIADDNGAGTVGVAFDATGVGIRMGFGAGHGTDEPLAGFQYALTANVDVMNNSWGYTSPFSDNFASATFSPFATALKNLADLGRGGLGANVVFAAGNSGDSGDNVNYHNFQNSPYVISVAAIDSAGHVAYFSNPGAALLVSAGGVDDLTTDKTGTGGYAMGNYATVSGTSFAAPTVSGLIGLMLEANPSLGWRDVQEILAYSAQHNDPTSAGWQYNGATNWNGGGLHFSHDYGFGAADAFTAIRLAETWNQQQTSANMATFTTATATPALAVPDLSTVTMTMNVAQDVTIEHVQISLNLSHTWAGDLVVTLISPDGTESVLVDRPGSNSAGDYSGGINFVMETNASWGESSAGTWTLEIQDMASGDVGTLNSWSMTFLGNAPSTDDLYVYTNDFASFAGADLASRSVISDADGGVDTLNLAAVTIGSAIDLSAGTGAIAGLAVTIAGIEKVYTGDGNDTVTGNTADNGIYTGRGNDAVTGSDGNDVLNGGAGTDLLSYLENIASFTFEFISATVLNITHAVGAAWTDAVSNFENFSFTDGLFSFAQLQELAGGGGGGGSGGGGSDPLVQNGGSGADVLTGTAGNDTLSGNDGNDTLSGLAGDDILNGGAGLDNMSGGDGNDTYYVDNIGDVLADSSGADTVHSTISFTLGTGLENLILDGGAAINGTGNGLANVLTGNAGANILQGGSGNDILDGGAGADRLTGGQNADTFVFHTATAFTNPDTVTDFKTSQGDKLDIHELLSAYDPVTELLTDFVQITSSKNNSIVSVDLDGAGTAYGFAQIATLTGATGLTDENALVTAGNLIVTG
ncbi:MAG: type I secretion C-terminal target domain-containing protein [Alphaproteobacteria bacterium]|nr:MAG: type I secretion C-terminal target domain-containing protein [Alphaproteobacteria bacterium]